MGSNLRIYVDNTRFPSFEFPEGDAVIDAVDRGGVGVSFYFNGTDVATGQERRARTKFAQAEGLLALYSTTSGHDPKEAVRVQIHIAEAIDMGHPVLLVVWGTDPGLSKFWDNPGVLLVDGADPSALTPAVAEFARRIEAKREDNAVNGASDNTFPASAWRLESVDYHPPGTELKNPVNFKQMDLGALLPTRGHADDAGFDLYTSVETKIPVGEFVDVPCGVSVDLPDGYWGLITGRSSTLRNLSLLVPNGIIDNGYTGSLFVGAMNIGNRPVTVPVGDRIGQIVLLPSLPTEFRAQWGEMRPKARGNKGFGSTGS